MIGSGHARMGAAFWLTGCAATQVCGAVLSPAVLTIGTAVCAGAALVPDIDHPESRLANAAGPVTRAVARWFADNGRVLHAATRTRRDRVDDDGHRTWTHMLLFALVTGGLVTWWAWRGGPSAAAVLVFALGYVGLRAALPWRLRTVRLRWRTRVGRRWRTRRARIPVPVSVASVLAAAAFAAAPGSAWWLGLAYAAGLVIHAAGDMLTGHGVPWLALLVKIRGQWWFKIAVPVGWRFATGGRFERLVVHPLLLVQIVAAVVVLVYPPLRAWWSATAAG